MSKDRLVALTATLHQKLRTQARNLLFEYKFSVTDEELRLKRGYVPVEVVQKLMELYGNLLAREIWDAQQAAQRHPVDVLKELFGDKLDPETEKELRAICDEPVKRLEAPPEIPC